MSENRYFPNKLELLPLSQESLETALSTLQDAINNSIILIENQLKKHPVKESDSRNKIYTGYSGIALMFLRLLHQKEALALPTTDISIDQSRVRDCLPSTLLHSAAAGSLAPMSTPVGPAVLKLLTAHREPRELGESLDDEIQTFKNAVKHAINSDDDGDDEAMRGRAGLLWATTCLQLRAMAESDSTEPAALTELNELLTQKSYVSKMVEKVVEAGLRGHEFYKQDYEDSAPPLMWEYHGKYYLGAIHGSAGILTALFQAPKEAIKPHLPLLVSTTDALAELIKANNGHLPSSLPAKQRTHPYVQICHGAPGFVLLLATIKNVHPEQWKPLYQEALDMARTRIWEEGLVKKGISLCHGVTGNALVLLLSTLSEPEEKNNDVWLSKALTMLVHATNLPPLGNEHYRTPDHPLSMFEGLAGAVCAWSDTVILIREKLENSGVSKELLGFPCLGGVGVRTVI